MKRIITVFLFFFFSLGTSASAPTHLTTLPNGLTLYTREDHARPLISLFSIVDGGSRTETEEIAGLSHFYEHLIARGGSKKQAETEYRRQMMLLGESHIYTYDDGTAYGFTVPVEHFDEALWRLADFMMGLIPDTAGIRKERTIVMEELHMSYSDDPRGSCYEQLLSIAFTRHPYFPATIGLAEVIETADLPKLKTFYEERYVPNQIVMAVVGDFDTEEIIARVNEQFGHYRSGKISFELGITEPPQTDFRQVVKEMDVSSAYCMLGFKIPPTVHPDMPAIRVLSKILGEELNSRLQKRLIQEENLVYSINCWTDFLRDGSLLYVFFQCDPDKIEPALTKIFAEIKSIAVEESVPHEVVSAREKLMAEDILAKQTYRGQAEAICHYHIRKAPSLVDHYIPLVRSIAPSEVKRAAQNYLNPAFANLSLVVPRGTKVSDFALLAGSFDLTPAKTSTVKADSATVYEKLSNGLTLIVRGDPASPTFCIKAFVRGGQWLEGEGKSGVGYLTADLLSKGTEKYPRAELQESLSNLSLDLKTTAHEDYLQVELSGLIYALQNGLELLDQILFHPTFPEDEFEQAKSRQLQAVDAVEDQPWEFTHREALADLYHESPYRNLVVGSKKDVKKLKNEDVKKYYHDAFKPQNIVMAAVGDFIPENLCKQLKEQWESLPPESPLSIGFIDDRPPQKANAHSVYKEKDQNTFNISFLTVGVDHPDFLPLVIAARILNTRLFFKYIYEKGMAYRMWTRLHPRLGQARFYFEMGCSDENFPVAVAGILQDLNQFLTQPISEEDIKTAIQDEITRNQMTCQTNEGIAEGSGYWEMVGLGYRFYDNFAERINSVAALDVERVSRKYLSSDRYRLVNVGTAEVK